MKKALNPKLVTSSWAVTDLHDRTVAVSWGDNPFDTAICRFDASPHSGSLWIMIVAEPTRIEGNTFRTRRHTLTQAEADSITLHADQSIAEFRCRIQPPTPSK